MTRFVLACVALLVAASAAGAQIVNDTFRTGVPPAGWTFATDSGAAAPPQDRTARGLVVAGAGSDMTWWQRRVPGLKPRTMYRIRFSARSEAAGVTGGCVIAGLDTCNRDFIVESGWKPYTFIFTTPDDVSRAALRLGQWHWRGRVRFEAVQLSEVTPVHRSAQGASLGEYERMDSTGYHYLSEYAGPASNGGHILVRHTAAFNSSRWVFGDGAEVVYRHDVCGGSMLSATVRVSINLREAGAIEVSVSRDGETWNVAGRAEALGRTLLQVPAEVFPASQLYVRMRGVSSARAGAAGGVAVQVAGYKADAALAPGAVIAGGQSAYLTVGVADPAIAVQVLDLGPVSGEGDSPLVVELRPAPRVEGHAMVSLALRPETGRAAAFTTAVQLRPGVVTARLPYRWRGSGAIDVALNVIHIAEGSSRRVYGATAEGYASPYLAENYGYALAPSPAGPLWWCEGTYKIHPARAVPPAATGGKPAPVRMTAARREREHVQIVLRPSADPGPIQVSASDLTTADGARIAARAVEIREVGYLPVSAPSDRVGVAADWPDPLPPLRGAWRPAANRNNPLWITVTVPASAQPGDYAGTITLRGAAWTRAVPLRVQVWGFALPERTVLRSGFGVDPGLIRRYHNLKSDASLEKVWDYYMRAFARVHLAPYDPMALAPYRVTRKPGSVPAVDMDFTAFDRAARRYLDGVGFNAFTIGLQGLGGGRYPEVNHGSFLGAAAGTPEYDALMKDYGRQLTDHLRSNGWLDKAYVYWYDEPGENDYGICREGGDTIRRYAPGVKRMMTEQFEEPLKGYVDLWCPITPEYREAPFARRQALGEEVWWYVCTGPKEPYCGLFIDHPAIDLRMWLWQTWKYRVQGVLIWATTWWNSPSHNTGSQVQNPWTDPMAYSDSGGTWGNGDGRFFYPPNRDPNASGGREYVEPPVVAMRLEMLGKGIDDWTYFKMLQDLVQAAKKRGDNSPDVAAASKLLVVPQAICRDMTTFTVDPQLMFRHREALARAIVRLQTRAGSAR